MAPKKQGGIQIAQKSRAAQGRLRIRKHAVLPAPFWLKYNRKILPTYASMGEFFSADFISKIHWQNCFAPKKSKFCAEPRHGGAGMLSHGKTAQRRSQCKICLFTAHVFLMWSRPKRCFFHSIKRCISCGIGAVKCNFCPVTGWVNHSSYECSAGRAMRVLSSMP